jgi:hypothetical protein
LVFSLGAYQAYFPPKHQKDVLQLMKNTALESLLFASSGSLEGNLLERH